jgi:hypothetical protein
MILASLSDTAERLKPNKAPTTARPSKASFGSARTEDKGCGIAIVITRKDAIQDGSDRLQQARHGQNSVASPYRSYLDFSSAACQRAIIADKDSRHCLSFIVGGKERLSPIQ